MLYIYIYIVLYYNYIVYYIYIYTLHIMISPWIFGHLSKNRPCAVALASRCLSREALPFNCTHSPGRYVHQGGN